MSADENRRDPDVDVIARVFAPLDKIAFGCAAGLVLGLVLALATAVLLLRGGPDVGRTLSLLGHFFPGYSVSWTGVPVGLGYGFGAGFVVGWLFAAAKNVMVLLSLRQVRLKADRESSDLLEKV